MTKDEFVQASMDIYAKKKEIEVLSKQRASEEQDLIDEYKVIECNSKRNELAKRYSGLINDKHAEIKAIEDSII